nr:MAG: hypothetical protein [Porcellio scaber clopovirus]
MSFETIEDGINFYEAKLSRLKSLFENDHRFPDYSSHSFKYPLSLSDTDTEDEVDEDEEQEEYLRALRRIRSAVSSTRSRPRPRLRPPPSQPRPRPRPSSSSSSSSSFSSSSLATAIANSLEINYKIKQFEEADKREFIHVLLSLREDVERLAQNEENIKRSRCSVTFDSAIEALLDSNLPVKILECGKFDFLRHFTLTGIPVIVETTTRTTTTNDGEFTDDYSFQKSPWNLKFELRDKNNIYSLVSQTVLSDFDRIVGKVGSRKLNENRRGFWPSREKNNFIASVVELGGEFAFNSVVPIFTPEEVGILKPLFRTNVLVSLCTFCVLRDPHQRPSDKDTHLAALIGVWVELINRHEEWSRFYIQSKLKSICDTASIYLDWPHNARYKKALIETPGWALSKRFDDDDSGDSEEEEEEEEEDSEYYDDTRIDCFSENLSKALFFLYVYRDDLKEERKIIIFSLLMREYIDRLISQLVRYNTYEVVLVYMFTSREEKFSRFTDEPLKNSTVMLEAKYCSQEIIDKIERKYRHRRLHHRLRNEKIVKELISKIYDKNMMEFEGRLKFRETFLKNCRDEEIIGDFCLSDLELLAFRVFGFSKNTVERLFDSQILFLYVFDCLFAAHAESGKIIINTKEEKLEKYYRAKEIVASSIQRTFKVVVTNNVLRYFSLR